VDEAHGDTAIGRSHADAPEIDGVVRVAGAKGARPGDLLRVTVTASDEHDLAARLAMPKRAARGA
jgi:ribosomal protein S12 methylthiotransferase